MFLAHDGVFFWLIAKPKISLAYENFSISLWSLCCWWEAIAYMQTTGLLGFRVYPVCDNLRFVKDNLCQEIPNNAEHWDTSETVFVLKQSQYIKISHLLWHGTFLLTMEQKLVYGPQQTWFIFLFFWPRLVIHPSKATSLKASGQLLLRALH